MRIGHLLLVLGVAFSIAGGIGWADESDEDPAGDAPQRPSMDFLMKGTDALQGVWVTADGRYRIEIPKIGIVKKFLTLSQDMQATVLEGHGAYEDGMLKVWVQRPKSRIVEFRCQLGDGVLDLTDAEGNTVRYLLQRPETDAADEEMPDPQAVIVGSWRSEDPHLTWTYEFTRDGRFASRRVLRETREYQTGDGAYRFEEGKLVLVFESAGGKELTQGFRVASPDAIEIIDSKGVVLRVFREGADHSPGGPERLPGMWAVEKGKTTIRLSLALDGTMEHWQSEGDEEPRVSIGRYKATDQAFTMWLSGLEERRFRHQMPNDDVWVLGSGGSDQMRFLRIGQALATESRDVRPPKETGIVGIWEVEEEGMRIEVTLAADGSFTNQVTAQGETETIRGTYEFKDGMLIARPKNDDPLRFEAKLLDANRLQVKEETGEVTVLTRKKKARRGFFGGRGKKAEPKPDGRMVGDWLMRSAEIQIRIVLRADATYEETVRTKEGTETTKGRYEVSGGMLVARPEGGAEPVRLKVRLVDDDTMELLDADGNGVQLKRQG